MKQIYLLLFFSLVSIFNPCRAQEQSWPEPGMTWSYCYMFGWPPNYYEDVFAWDSDTLINGQTYQKVITSDLHPNLNPDDFSVYLRQSGDTIYRNVNLVDYVFFINNLEPGDTFTTFRTSRDNFNESMCTGEMILEVQEVEMVEINGVTYRRVVMGDINWGSSIDTTIFEELADEVPEYSFIEGIGLQKNFPYQHYMEMDNFGDGQCFIIFDVDYNARLYLHDTSDGEELEIGQGCNLLSSSDIGVSHPGAHVFPNPSRGNITVEMNNFRSPTRFSIINPLGHKVLSGTLTQSVTSIDLGNLPNGLYIIQIAEKGVAKRILVVSD